MGKVSVIIPTFNRRDVVCNAVDSVLGQEASSCEVIVCDDASDDGTKELLLKRYGGLSNFKYHRLPRNRGGSAARNLGIEVAQGKFISFLDSDDVWKQGKLASCIGVFEKTALGEKDILYHQCELIDGTGISIEPMDGLAENELLLDYVLLRGGQIRTPSLFMLSETAKKIRFDENLRLHQDWDFCARAQVAGCNFHFIPVPLTVVYREMRGDRISENYDLDASAEWLDNRRDLMGNKAFARRMCAILRTKHRRGEGVEPAHFSRWLLAGGYGIKKTLGLMVYYWTAR